MHRRAGNIVLALALAVAVAVTAVGALVDASPRRVVMWMIASLAILAIGMFVYGRLTRRAP